MKKVSALIRLRAKLRRLQLGPAYKHQYQCHPDFCLQPHTNGITVLWRNKPVAEVGNVRSLRNSDQGECFIVASGPSLGEVDFSRLANKVGISLNCSIKRFIDAGFQPRYSIIVDRRVFENHWECVRNSVLSGATCFFSFIGLSRICEREPALLAHGNVYLVEAIERRFGIPRISAAAFVKKYVQDPDVFIDTSIPAIAKIAGFSVDCDKGFFPGKTVVTWGVQLAAHLGYTTNYILGMDLGATGPGYFYGDAANSLTGVAKDYEPYIRVSFEQARRAAERNGFRIFNLSTNSALPGSIIEKIDHQKVIY
jgi:Kdo-III transferase WaaZ